MKNKLIYIIVGGMIAISILAANTPLSTKVWMGLRDMLDSSGRFSALTFSDDTVQTTAGGGLANIVEDTTPQLGGDLDVNSKNIDFPTTANISDVLDEDNMVSDSATKLATQQSIKAYADSVGGGGWTDSAPHVTVTDTTDNVSMGTSTANAKLDVQGTAIFNDDGADLDFRIEGDTNANLVYVDAGNDRVGINNGAPATALDVTGTITASLDFQGRAFIGTGAVGSHKIGASNASGFTGSGEVEGDINYDATQNRWEQYDGTDWNEYIITNEDAASTTVVGVAELATTAEIDTGTDNTRAMPIDQFVASKRNIRWLVFNLVEKATDSATATNIAGDFLSPIAGTVLQSDTSPFFLYATNSTAGVTGTMVVDISFGGTSIMTTNKLDFDTTEKTTTTAATPPDLTDTTLAVGDIITIDIDSIHTTAAKGLTVYMAVRE